jgi:DNA mismatch repair protein MutS2
MKERNLRVLEFTKIRDQLAALCLSEPGRARAQALIPSGDEKTVRMLQGQTEEASVVMAYVGGSAMQYFPDVGGSLKIAAVGGTLSPKALLQVAEALKASRLVRAALVTERENTPLLTQLASHLSTHRELEEEIFNAILSEDEIADRASAELYNIRRHMRLLADKAREKLNSFLRGEQAKYLQDAIVTQRNGRYVLPVKAECRTSVPGLIHDQSASGATLFIEPMSVVEMGNDLKQWAVKEEKEIERILAALSNEIAPDAQLLASNLNILAELDVVFAKALLARQMKAVEPKLNTQGRIKILSGRHPLIDPAQVVPISLWMGGEFTTLIITGPNTGGKTVTMKTVGLMTLMAQAGLAVPAMPGTELAVFDEVFADIGDEQSIEQSLSTFSSHMTNIVGILKNVSPNSLALFDELGAGTDPTEGAALAMSILEHLLSLKVTTLATTHYSELKAFALSTPGVENASVEFDVETLRPTYRLSIGVPGKSNAFEISRKLGLPEFLIQSAGERLSKEQIRFEDVIANAQYHRQIAEKERQLAEQAHRETQALRDEADKMRKQLEAQREDALRKAREDARKVLIKAQRESEQIIAELKRSRKNEGAPLREHQLHEMRAKLQSGIDETGERMGEARPAEAPKDLKPGEDVEILRTGTRATIITPPDAKGEALVQAGVMKLKVAASGLKRVKEEKKRKTSSFIAVSQKPVALECDLRGLTLDEALMSVDMFLDGAVMQHLKNVSIIHGKGTGVLRSGVQAHLKQHPAVREYRLGRYGEGEDGVTVVTLK